MENLYKYTVAGHTFAVILPDDFSEEEYLSSYLPFTEKDSQVEPLFTLKLEMSDSLKELNCGVVRECLNDEAPYFWLFEAEAGRYNFGFSHTKNRPDCILIPSEDYRNSTVYVPSAYASKSITEVFAPSKDCNPT